MIRLEQPVVLEHAIDTGVLDAEIGHLSHVAALRLLEAGRVTWLERHGFRRAGRILAVVERAEVDYHREVFPGAAWIQTSLEHSALAVTYRAVFTQTIEVEHGGTRLTAVSARIQVAFVDGATRCVRTLQDFFEERA